MSGRTASVRRPRLVRATAVAACLVVLLAACGSAAPPLAGGDAGSLDAVAAPTAAPETPQPEPSPAPTPPAPSPGPDATPTTPPSERPGEDPPDAPSEDPDATATPQDTMVPFDLDHPSIDLWAAGLVDPARAAAVNQFRGRPVVLVLQARLGPVDGVDEGVELDEEALADVDAASTVGLLRVLATDEQGAVVPGAGGVQAQVTRECPAWVEPRIVLRPAMGQRLCVVFDVRGNVDIESFEVALDGNRATVAAADLARWTRIDEPTSRDVGVPQGVRALGQVVDAQLATVDGGTAEVALAVTGVSIGTHDDGDVAQVQLTLQSATGVTIDRITSTSLGAISPEGVQRTYTSAVETAECSRPSSVPLEAETPVDICLPILVPEGVITQFARFVTADDRVVVWRVLLAGGGEASNNA